MTRLTTDPASRARADRFHAAAETSAVDFGNARVPGEVHFGSVRIAPAGRHTG